MMKSFILAATSIAYILCISSSADAKVAKINKSVDRGQSCQNPVNSTPQYNQLTKNNISLNKDIKNMCNLINEKYKKYNINASRNDDLTSTIKSAASGSFTTAVEVTSIEIDGYQGPSQSKMLTFFVNVKLIMREYSWERGKNEDKWNLTKSTPQISRLYFGMRDGEWRIIDEIISSPTSRNTP